MIQRRVYIFTLLLIGLIFTSCTLSRVQNPKAEQTLKSGVLMQGMYSYMADAAIFKECISGVKYPVAFEEDNLELERAYLKIRRVSGEALKVHIDAEIVLREGMDGIGMRPTILVKRFIKIIPKESCQNRLSQANLTNTYWKLTQLDNKPIASSSRREAHMILQSSGTIKGSTGCNNMRGAYIINGDKISLSKHPMLMSRMFCQGSVEREFISALKKMRSYKVKGEYLEIFDADSINLAKFESVYLY